MIVLHYAVNNSNQHLIMDHVDAVRGNHCCIVGWYAIDITMIDVFD